MSRRRGSLLAVVAAALASLAPPVAANAATQARAARDDQYERLRELAGAGIGSTLILGSPANGSAGLEGLLGVAAGLDGVEALEGPNEYSTLGGDPDWIANLRAYQEELYEGSKAEPALAALPVIGPAIVHGDQDELGDVSEHLDRGNLHSYPQGNPPDKLKVAIERAELNSKEKPIWATETGYNNALAWSGKNRPVAEDAAATYMPRLFLEYWRWGIERTFASLGAVRGKRGRSSRVLRQWPPPGRSLPAATAVQVKIGVR